MLPFSLFSIYLSLLAQYCTNYPQSDTFINSRLAAFFGLKFLAVLLLARIYALFLIYVCCFYSFFTLVSLQYFCICSSSFKDWSNFIYL